MLIFIFNCYWSLKRSSSCSEASPLCSNIYFRVNLFLVNTKYIKKKTTLTEGLPERQSNRQHGKSYWSKEWMRAWDTKWYGRIWSNIAVMSSHWRRERFRIGLGSQGRGLRRVCFCGKSPGPRDLFWIGKWHNYRWWIVILHLSVVKAKLKWSLQRLLFHWVCQ